MKREDFDKIFTERVNEYLQKGYLISTQHGAGHQGEIAKVVLINPKQNIRMCLWLESKHGYGLCFNNIIVFKIGIQSNDDNKGFWLSELNIVYEKYYFNVSNKYKEWYIDDYEEALRCNNLHYERSSYPPSIKYNYYSKRFINYGWNWFKDNKPQGMSKYRKKDIIYIQKYKASYDNKIYFLLYFKDGNYVQINKDWK